MQSVSPSQSISAPVQEPTSATQAGAKTSPPLKRLRTDEAVSMNAPGNHQVDLRSLTPAARDLLLEALLPKIDPNQIPARFELYCKDGPVQTSTYQLRNLGETFEALLEGAQSCENPKESLQKGLEVARLAQSLYGHEYTVMTQTSTDPDLATAKLQELVNISSCVRLREFADFANNKTLVAATQNFSLEVARNLRTGDEFLPLKKVHGFFKDLARSEHIPPRELQALLILSQRKFINQPQDLEQTVIGQFADSKPLEPLESLRSTAVNTPTAGERSIFQFSISDCLEHQNSIALDFLTRPVHARVLFSTLDNEEMFLPLALNAAEQDYQIWSQFITISDETVGRPKVNSMLKILETEDTLIPIAPLKDILARTAALGTNALFLMKVLYNAINENNVEYAKQLDVIPLPTPLPVGAPDLIGLACSAGDMEFFPLLERFGVTLTEDDIGTLIEDTTAEDLVKGITLLPDHPWTDLIFAEGHEMSESCKGKLPYLLSNLELPLTAQHLNVGLLNLTSQMSVTLIEHMPENEVLDIHLERAVFLLSDAPVINSLLQRLDGFQAPWAMLSDAHHRYSADDDVPRLLLETRRREEGFSVDDFAQANSTPNPLPLIRSMISLDPACALPQFILDLPNL